MSKEKTKRGPWVTRVKITFPDGTSTNLEEDDLDPAVLEVALRSRTFTWNGRPVSVSGPTLDLATRESQWILTVTE